MLHLTHEFNQIGYQLLTFERNIYFLQKELSNTRKKHASLKAELNCTFDESKKISLEKELVLITDSMNSKVREISLAGKKLTTLKGNFTKLKHFFNVFMTKKDNNSLLEYKYYLDQYKKQVIDYLN